MAKYGNQIHGLTSSSSTEISSSSQPPSSSQTLSSSSIPDPFSAQITNHKLNGQNYLQWSQSVLMFICGKSKDDLLSESTTAPKEDDPAYKSWKANNNMVMSWLINSMTLDIGENITRYMQQLEMHGKVAKITFSSSENTSEIFETESVLHELKQGDLSVTQYYSLLTRHWQKIDRIDTHNWKCPEDGKLYISIVETNRGLQIPVLTQ
ncbi:hypothetical protein Syun_018204 [Stephania yunnanensis]|uniref:Retrotransposon Copia-like N-terminal domain-containing protein n=1 Tax=Stephania yunnanensis TaxID=152371 RepID=A0AAP0ITR3_9MAGN